METKRTRGRSNHVHVSDCSRVTVSTALEITNSVRARVRVLEYSNCIHYSQRGCYWPDIHICRCTSSEAGDNWAAYLGSNLLDSFKISVADYGEPGLNDVDIETL